MGYAIPSSNDFKLQHRSSFPYAVKGFGSVIALTLAGGAITAARPLAGGYGYAPGAGVQISDPTGTGAVLTATVNNGALISVAVTAGGAGYSAPQATLFGGDNSKDRLVTDDDINGAIADATPNVNEDFFPNQAAFTRGFLWLAAHLLVENVLAAVEGLSSQYSWLTAAKSVDGVNQSFQIPKWVQEDPYLASLCTTRYGLAYLRLALPYMIGHVAALPRCTNPV